VGLQQKFQEGVVPEVTERLVLVLLLYKEQQFQLIQVQVIQL
jgi:hypothetical protein